MSSASTSSILVKFQALPLYSSLEKCFRSLYETSDLSQFFLLLIQFQNGLNDLRVMIEEKCDRFQSVIPVVLLRCIFEFIPWTDLIGAERVCRKWHSYLRPMDAPWKSAFVAKEWSLHDPYLLTIPPPPSLTTTSIWRERVRQKLILEKNWCHDIGTEIALLHGSGLNSVGFHENYIVSGGTDTFIGLWDANQGWNSNKSLRGHRGAVTSIKIYCTDFFLSGSEDQSIKVWDTNTGICKRTLNDHTDSIWCFDVAYANFPSVISTTTTTPSKFGFDNEETGNESKGGFGGGSCANSIVSCSGDKTIKEWDLEAGKCVQTLHDHQDAVVTICSINNLVVSGSCDTTVKLWDLKSGDCISTVRDHTGEVYAVYYDSKRIVSGGKSRMIRIWDPKKLTSSTSSSVPQSNNRLCLQNFDGHQELIRSLCGAGKRLISGSWDSTIRLWDMESGLPIRVIPNLHKVGSLSCSSTHLISGDYGGKIRFWNFEQRKRRKDM